MKRRIDDLVIGNYDHGVALHSADLRGSPFYDLGIGVPDAIIVRTGWSPEPLKSLVHPLASSNPGQKLPTTD
jgi:hypothetical protein